MSLKQIVIVGAGFAGLEAAKTLIHHIRERDDIKITLIDEKNHHLFQPLLYQVATAGLNPADIAFPIRSLFHSKKIEVLMGKVTNIDSTNRTISYEMSDGLSDSLQASSITQKRFLSYDYLLLACGATHSYFGHEEKWEENAPGLKTLEQAIEIRRRVLLAFEQAELLENREAQQEWLTFIIVGGGPTGVELAGSLAEIAYYTLARDFVRVDVKQTKIILIEAGDCLIPSFAPNLSKAALKALKKLGVEVKLNTAVTEIECDQVQLKDGSLIKAHTILWAAGVKPSPLNQFLVAPDENKKGKTKLDDRGRVFVTKYLSLADHPDIFVVGDQNHFVGGNTGGIDNTPLPGLASVAKQQGAHATQNMMRTIDRKELLPFHYFDKGQMATIGRNQAVMQFKKIKISGFLAWVAWLLVHIYYLIGFRNRFFVFLTWAWSYLTYSKGARLIIAKKWRSFMFGLLLTTVTTLSSLSALSALFFTSQQAEAMYANVYYWKNVNYGLGHIAVEIFNNSTDEFPWFYLTSTDQESDQYLMRNEKYDLYRLRNINLDMNMNRDQNSLMRLEKELSDYRKNYKYDLLKNNCAHLVHFVLKKMGYKYHLPLHVGPLRPIHVAKSARTLRFN